MNEKDFKEALRRTSEFAVIPTKVGERHSYGRYARHYLGSDLHRAVKATVVRHPVEWVEDDWLKTKHHNGVVVNILNEEDDTNQTITIERKHVISEWAPVGKYRAEIDAREKARKDEVRYSNYLASHVGAKYYSTEEEHKRVAADKRREKTGRKRRTFIIDETSLLRLYADLGVKVMSKDHYLKEYPEEGQGEEIDDEFEDDWVEEEEDEYPIIEWF